MKHSSNKLPPTRHWRAPLVILLILALGAAVAGAAIWWVNRPIEATVLTLPEKTQLDEKLAAIDSEQDDPEYVRGEKEIVLTEREINGLLHANTPLGNQLKLELANDAVHARINADIPADFPVMAGKKLKGKARFLIANEAGNPALILDDLTVYGISLPNAWLGDLKGQNLLGAVLSPGGGSLAGIEDISVSQRKLIIKLAE